jgi:hypothetical protein
MGIKQLLFLIDSFSALKDFGSTEKFSNKGKD